MTEWPHNFEDGPPKLSGNDLEEVDEQSRGVEIERLLNMKVLKELPENADSGSYKLISAKVVCDWRHRDGQWKRRGRLSVREFKCLSFV